MNRTVVCWGFDAGNGNVRPPSGKFQEIALGYDQSIGLRDDGSIAVWGSTSAGQDRVPTGIFTHVGALRFRTVCSLRAQWN